MITYLIQVTMCMAVFYGFYVLALRKETFFQANRLYLLISLVLSLVFPLIRIYIDLNPTQSIAMAPVYVGAYMQTVEIGINTAQKGFSFSWQEIFTMIYGAGVLLLAIRFFFSIRAILVLKSKATITMVDQQLCAISPLVKSPFSFLNLVYLPSKHSFSQQEMEEVICHERAHVEGRHSIDVIMLEILSIFLWLNPLIYFYKKSIKEIHEFIADAAVVKKTHWTVYSEFLVQQKEQCFQGSLTSQLPNQLIYSQLKNRLIMMAQKPSTVLAKWKFSGVIPLLLISMLIFSFREKEQSAGTKSDKIYNIYEDGLKVYGFGISEQPIFPGCEKMNDIEKADCSQKKMFEYVAQHLKYPEDMNVNKTEGKVYVKFIITDKGYVADVQIQKSLSPSADRAALDIVNGMNKNVGKWTPGSKDGKPVAMEMVLPISFVLATQTDQNSKPNIKQEEKWVEMPAQTDEPFTYVEHMPTFPEGQDAMYKFIYERIKYPATARENGISGVVIIQFVVSKDGDIQNAKVLRGIGGGCNEEALRVINEMPRWNPGQHDGRNVPVTFTMPIKFVLQDPKPNPSNSVAPADNTQNPVSSNALNETTVITSKEPAKTELKEEIKALNFSPNPANDHITIELFDGAKSINLFDAKGALVMKKDLYEMTNKNYQLDITSIPAGIFTLQVTSNNETRAGLLTKIK